MDATAHYRNLVSLGRAEFLASAAPAALVRYHLGKGELASGATTLTLDQDSAETVEETLPHGKDFGLPEDTNFAVFPLAKKPGALRNGAPFKDWPLPASLERVRRKLKGSDDGDRQMVKVLSAVLTDGLAAVEAACAEALADVRVEVDPHGPSSIVWQEVE